MEIMKVITFKIIPMIPSVGSPVYEIGVEPVYSAIVDSIPNRVPIIVSMIMNHTNPVFFIKIKLKTIIKSIGNIIPRF